MRLPEEERCPADHGPGTGLVSGTVERCSWCTRGASGDWHHAHGQQRTPRRARGPPSLWAEVPLNPKAKSERTTQISLRPSTRQPCTWPSRRGSLRGLWTNNRYRDGLRRWCVPQCSATKAMRYLTHSSVSNLRAVASPRSWGRSCERDFYTTTAEREGVRDVKGKARHIALVLTPRCRRPQ